MKRTSFPRAGFVAILGFLLLTGFQNCAPQLFESASYPSHGLTQQFRFLAQSKVLVGDRDYLESVLKDVFLTDSSPAADQTAVKNYLTSEFSPSQQLLGRGCDPLESGDSVSCNRALQNANLKMDTQTSSGREALKAQVCAHLVANDSILKGAVSKLAAPTVAPTIETLQGIVHLFFPAMDAPAARVIAGRLDILDKEMAANSETILDRWRMAFLVVCESPGWDMF